MGGGLDQTVVGIMKPEKTKRLYTLSEAALYLGRSTWSIRRLIWKGDLPQVRAGGRVHVDIRDMDVFIDKHKEQELA